jgi:hypothetical protein
MARDGVIGQRRRDAGDAAAGALGEDLLDCELSDKDKPSEVGGDETVKVVGGVVREGLAFKDARVVDDMIDGAEHGDRSLCDLLRGCCLTDVSIDECEVR